ncbi:hypothetical protein FQR65_LT18472 [Abscondita terminalis]|nr:hypothetical protein FQR65_LT18472 [Abscondita terminalis]
MSRSDLLLLDEPTNHLDLDAILWLEDWLKAYEGTLILISHDRDFLDAITDHILHIENQILTLYTGQLTIYFETTAEPYTTAQQAFEKQQEAKETKFILSYIYIAALISRPKSGEYSPGRRLSPRRRTDTRCATMDTPSESFSGGERARLALALIVWLRPNVLILDEPTNHLDLDMRHALTMALQDFEGAVVLVSHERQLIASVCDELILVHAGQSKEFDGDLQDYAAWLRQARIDMMKNGQKPSAPIQSQVVEKTSISKVDKEAQRKEAARQRELSRPIRKNIEKIESQIGKIQPRLVEIEESLADSALYEANRKDDLLKLMNEQTELKTKLEQAEEQMLELMMELETLESSFE